MHSRLLREALRTLGSTATQVTGHSTQLNGGEWYADRIKRDYRLPDYADARAMYISNPAYWEKYYNPPPTGLSGKAAFVGDSAAHAGVPNRYNVFEYGFPEPGSTPTVATSNLSPSAVTGGSWKDVFVRDSVAAAGIPSRNNVFEYGYPEPGSVSSSTIKGSSIGRSGDGVHLPGLSPRPRGFAWNDVFVRDSAATAGAPSRNNVFEYGFPEPGSVLPPLTTPGPMRGAGYVGGVVASPVPFIPAAPNSGFGGLPGLVVEAGLNGSQKPDAPPPGGLVGLIKEYLRDSSR